MPEIDKWFQWEQPSKNGAVQAKNLRHLEATTGMASEQKTADNSFRPQFFLTSTAFSHVFDASWLSSLVTSTALSFFKTFVSSVFLPLRQA
jgi:hypothetical protein